jgi:hypothetical protein
MDNKITDKGWAAMHALLDREMPEKRSRKFGWWWLGLLLLHLMGYWSWQLMLRTKEPSQNIEANPISPMAGIVAKIESSENRQKHTFLSNSNYSNASEIKSTKVPIKQKAKVPTVGCAPLCLNDNRIIKEAIGTDIILFNVPEKKPALAIANLPGAEVRLIVLEQVINPSPQPVLASVSPISVKKTSINQWTFGATSAISTEQFSTINGFSTGLTVDWKFARKWGLRTGLFYNFHSPQEKHRPVASVDSDYYTSKMDGNVLVFELISGQEVINMAGANFFGDSLSGNVFIPVNRLQRLEIPVAAVWQALKPLKAFAGLSLTRTLFTKADKQNYSGAYILRLADQTAEKGASKLSSNELDNWKADAILGIGLMLGTSFELGFSTKMPLTKIYGLVRPNEGLLNPSSNIKSLGSARKQSGPVFSLTGTLFF